MTALVATPTNRVASAIASERVTALATPAARLLLAGSVTMAAISSIANMAAVDELNSEDTVQLVMHSSTVATLVFALIAGLYSATTDRRFGLIDQRVLSEPRRGTLLAAKSLVAGIVGLIYGAMGAITAIVTASLYYSLSNETFDLSSPLVVRALGGAMLAAPLFAVIGVAVGTIVANQPMAIGGSLAWMLIVEPTLVLGAPAIARWLPGASGLALTNVPDPNLFDQTPGALLLVGYAVTAFAIAKHRFATVDL